jgi:hypothetical protein
MAELFINPARATDSDNNPLSGAKLFFYATGGTTPADVYTTSALNVAHSNPVEADSSGLFPAIYLDPEVTYRAVCKNSTEATTIYDTDPIGGLGGATGAASVGFIQAGTGAVARTVQAKLREVVDAADFGVTADGTTDDLANLQKALDYLGGIGGGELRLPKGTIVISQAALVWSNTKIVGKGPGASIIKARQSGGFVGTNAGLTCFLLRNKNYSAGSLTDANITVESVGFDYGTVTVVGGGAHMIAMRYVDGVTVRNCYGTKGENVTAFLACRDTHVENCEGYNVLNCYFDHWDGGGTAKVIGCIGRNDPGEEIAQGIQFTGTGSALENRTSLDCYVTGCYLEGVRGAAGQASAIIANANDADSATFRMISIGNTVKDSDNGLVYEGEGGQHISIGDTLVEVDQLPIFLQTGNSDSPDNCRVINPHLIDCDHAPANIGMISVAGTGHSIRGVKVTNTGAAAYGSIGYLTAAASNCIFEIESAATGGAARIIDSGSSNTLIDGVASIAAAQTAWTAYTPTVSASTGSITSASATGRYKQIGKTVHFNLTVSITTNGTGADAVRATLPVTAQAANSSFGSGRNASTGALLQWANADTTRAFIFNNNGTYPGADGASLSISGTYEAA